MAEETTQPENSNKVPTQSLKDFIDETQKMIAVIGVFFALAILWKTLDPKGDPNIPFLCLLITIPLFVEVRREVGDYPSPMLVMFNFSFMGIFFATGFYILTKHWSEIGFQVWWSICLIAAITLWVLSEYPAKYIRQRRYAAVNRWRELELAKGLPDEEFTLRMDAKNRRLRQYYKNIGFLRAIVFVWIAMGLLVIWVNGETYRHLAYDVFFDQPLELRLDLVEEK